MARPTSKPAVGPERAKWRHSGHTPRRNAGLAAYENVLARAGLSPVAGIDEAGRGACAGPLVVAAVVLDCAAIRRMPGLADSKLLTPEERESVYTDVMRWALDWHVVAIPPQEVDALGLHVCNVEGMRRALAGLRRRPGYVLTDGFPVRGLGAPALAVWKGDQVTASVAAASVVAKVTRDRVMVELDGSYPAYGFARHKGYSTPEHMAALCGWGPCPEHRYSYVNVRQANRWWATGWQGGKQGPCRGPGPWGGGPDLPGARTLRTARTLPGARTLRTAPGPLRACRTAAWSPARAWSPEAVRRPLMARRWRTGRTAVMRPPDPGQISCQRRWPPCGSARPEPPGRRLRTVRTKLGTPPRAQERRMGPWLSSGDGTPQARLRPGSAGAGNADQRAAGERRQPAIGGVGMSAEDLEKYEAEMELQLYREYRDVVGLFSHVVETERRFYLTNEVELNVRNSDNGEVFFEVVMRDAWVWDMYRPARFVKNVRVVTFKDVNIEELAKSDLDLPEDKPGFPA